MNTPAMLTNAFAKPLTDEQLLYDFLLEAVQSNAPDSVLEDFRQLFIEARGFRQDEVFQSLNRLVRQKDVEITFNHFFNRCCHILINHWQLQPQHQRAIPKLVELLDKSVVQRGHTIHSSNRVGQLVLAFTQTEAFLRIQRVATIVQGKQTSDNQGNDAVGTLIHRYPYLYDYCLTGDDSSQEHQQMVRRMKVQHERHFEINLSRYVTYRVRLSQSNRSGLLLPQTELIQPVPNPTLLSDKELNRSIKHFVGTAERGQTYKALSQGFNNQIIHTPTFGGFKDNLYDYVLGSLDEKYQQGQFSKKLYHLLQNSYPDCNGQRPTEFLMMRTSSRLLNFLTVESAQQPDHYIFVDLIANMGVTRTVGLLLKVVLFCNKVKPYLEKRFSILFNHYESFSRSGVPWLVKSLENVQVAFSLHFGRVDLSGLKTKNLGV